MADRDNGGEMSCRVLGAGDGVSLHAQEFCEEAWLSCEQLPGTILLLISVSSVSPSLNRVDTQPRE